jgi:hypothetical protein
MRNRKVRIGSDKSPVQLGDLVEGALQKIGVTPEKVESWLGRPCMCRERKRKLNQLSDWAFRIFHGKSSQPKEELDKMLGSE